MTSQKNIQYTDNRWHNIFVFICSIVSVKSVVKFIGGLIPDWIGTLLGWFGVGIFVFAFINIVIIITNAIVIAAEYDVMTLCAREYFMLVFEPLMPFVTPYIHVWNGTAVFGDYLKIVAELAVFMVGTVIFNVFADEL